MATATLVSIPTPADYHRITSPTFKIPDASDIPIPVGILACQRLSDFFFFSFFAMGLIFSR